MSSAAVVSVLICACLLALAPGAFAAKGGNGGGSGSTTSGLSLVSDYVANSPNPLAPSWCLNEDDAHLRSWSGSVTGSFGATERLCDASVDYSGEIWWSAGGVGIQADLYVTGTLADLAITSPRGDSHHAVWIGSSTSKGKTTDHYQVCYVPPYSVSSNTGGTPLSGGTWQITVSGTLSKVSLSARAHMMDATFQQRNCPASEQNLVA